MTLHTEALVQAKNLILCRSENLLKTGLTTGQ